MPVRRIFLSTLFVLFRQKPHNQPPLQHKSNHTLCSFPPLNPHGDFIPSSCCLAISIQPISPSHSISPSLLLLLFQVDLSRKKSNKGVTPPRTRKRKVVFLWTFLHYVTKNMRYEILINLPLLKQVRRAQEILVDKRRGMFW